MQRRDLSLFKFILKIGKYLLIYVYLKENFIKIVTYFRRYAILS